MFFGQLAIVIALTLGKAYGSAASAVSRAGMLTSPICGKGLVTAKYDKKKHSVISRMPTFKDM